MLSTLSSIWQTLSSSVAGFYSSIDFTQHPLYVLDILIVAVVFYYIYVLLRGTRAIPIITGLAILILVSLISQQLNLSALTWLLSHLVTVVVIAIPVVFHDEIRRGLETIGQPGFYKHKLEVRGMRKVIRALVESCIIFSSQKIGALIVLKQDVNLGEVIETGVVLNATISSELLRTIFYPGSPLHDGAVIVEGDVVRAAACVLPLSLANRQVALGTRHKAALGIAEHTDAIAIVVSEEKGKISVAHNGTLTQNMTFSELESFLARTLSPERFSKNLQKVLQKTARRTGRLFPTEAEVTEE